MFPVNNIMNEKKYTAIFLLLSSAFSNNLSIICQYQCHDQFIVLKGGTTGLTLLCLAISLFSTELLMELLLGILSLIPRLQKIA